MTTHVPDARQEFTSYQAPRPLCAACGGRVRPRKVRPHNPGCPVLPCFLAGWQPLPDRDPARILPGETLASWLARDGRPPRRVRRSVYVPVPKEDGLPDNVRRVKGQGVVYQARVSMGSAVVNLGLFHARDYRSPQQAVLAARYAAREFVKRMAVSPRPDPWDVVQALQALTSPYSRMPVVPASVLPQWVYRRPDGLYGARRTSRATKVRIDLPGPWRDPRAAREAMRAELARRERAGVAA